MLGHIGLGSLKGAAILAAVISAVAIAVVAAQNPEFGGFFAKSAYVLLAGEEAALETPQPESSGVLYAITLYNQDGSVAGSGIGGVDAEPGNYDARVDFFDSAIVSAFLGSAEVDSNVLFFDVDEGIDEDAIAAPGGDYKWAHIVAVQPNVHFAYASIALRTPEGAGTLFRCDAWDFGSGKCSGAFEKISDAGGAETEVPLYLSPQAFGFAGTAPASEVAAEVADGTGALPLDVGAAPASAIDAGAVDTKVVESGGKTLTLRRQKASFAANDSPSVELDVSDASGNKVDAQVEAVLTAPDGSSRIVDTGKIKKTGAGKFSIEAPRPRSFKAGTYTLSVKATDKDGVVSEAEMSFEWGLIAVNTRKSIYRPGETAEFEIVVLDRESYGVRSAEVSMLLVSGQGLRELLSTANGLVKETTSAGIYVASTKVWDIGTYEVIANAKASGIDTTIKTNFLVAQDYDYDIIRRTSTKIDPAVQPIMVEIAVTALKGQESADIRETVPREFEVEPEKMLVVQNNGDEVVETYVNDPKVSVKENGDEKIIEWKNVGFGPGGTATVMYNYTVPDRKPWLYSIGPAEVASPDRQSFFEARSWMVAVDANPTGKLFFRNPDDINGIIEPMPNDANCGTGCGYASISYSGTTADINGVADIAGASTSTSRTLTLNAVTALFKFYSFVSPPLVPQTITANGSWAAGMGCDVSSTSNNTSKMQFAIYRWIASTDSNGERIANLFTAATLCGTATTLMHATKTGNFNTVSFLRGDKIVTEVDVNKAGTSTVRTIFLVFNGAAAPNDGNVTLPSGVTLRFAGDVNVGIIQPANNSAFTVNTAFDINAWGTCRGYDCGDANVTLKYCITPANGCATWFDMNTATDSPLYVSTGTAFRRDWQLGAGDANMFWFPVTGTVAGGTYTIRATIDSNWSGDKNYSNANNLDVNITINNLADYTFSLSYPPLGCTEGKGSIDAGVTCDKAYFETTDITGFADQNKVDAQGQNATTAFLVYNNQSTGPNDLNITLDLNAALPTSLKLKASKIYAGWAWTCTGNTDTNCVNVTVSAQNIGKAVYSTGSADLNIFIWADFNAAAAGQTNRDVNNISIAS